MATATVIDAITNVRTVAYTHSAAVVVGEIIVGNGNVMVAVNAKAINTENAYVVEGKINAPKEANLAAEVMDAVYWDSGNSKVTKTAAGNKALGHCAKKAAASDTTIDVYMRQYVKA